MPAVSSVMPEWPFGSAKNAGKRALAQVSGGFILETAVGAVKVRQVAAAPEDSGGGSVTHLELLRSSRNRPESRANARIPPLSTPCNCGL